MLDEPYVECQGMAELLIAKCKLQNKSAISIQQFAFPVSCPCPMNHLNLKSEI
jgi:hypothetical protein